MDRREALTKPGCNLIRRASRATRAGRSWVDWRPEEPRVERGLGEEPMGEILERPQAPTRHRLGVDAYTKMAEVGIFAHPHRVELIDGEIFDMAAIGSPHAAVTNRLVRSLAGAAADGRTLVSVQNPLRLDGYNEPQPDFMLVRPRADDYRGGHPSAADVLLLVEVSDSSLAYDRGTKLALYARFGVS